ncbi:MAG TPA: hypothetical protein VL463_21030 [Kofleriaceae bacterium]|nr:hypothetical protein [Kofleriaceae bacterium]
MALAARSSAEPRTACPVCGGSIHPIAGKCKHCKTDLVKLRRQQQGAAGTPPPARLPYGGAIGQPARAPTAPVVPINGNAHSAPVPMPMPMPAPVIIAPPVAATDPYVMSLPTPRGTWSRSWPIVVAVIAAAAIVVSVILLLTGGDKQHKTERALPPPAPDRMNTDPIPTDPWQGATPPGGGLGSNSGNTQPIDPTDPTPTPVVPPTPVAPTQPAPITSAPPPEKFSSATFEAICTRLASCGLDPSAKQICDDLQNAANQFGDNDTKDCVANGQCTYDRDKAVQCLNAINSLPCGQGQADIGTISTAMSGIAACTDALSHH